MEPCEAAVPPIDADGFVRWWHDRSRSDIEAMVAALSASTETVDGTLCWLRASREIGASLRRSGRTRVACQVAHRATEAALAACASNGLCATDRAAATRLARAAAEAARGLVAGGLGESTETVLRPFFGGSALSPT